MPRWYCDLRKFGFDGKTKTIVGHLLSLSYNGCPVIYSRDFGWHYLSDGEIGSIPRRSSRKGAVRSLFSRDLIQLTAKPSTKLLYDCLRSDLPSKFTWRAILRLALRTIAACRRDILLNQRDPWLKQLDWAILDAHPETNTAQTEDEHQLVPKWYWAQMKAEKDADSISMEVTVRSRIAPLLLRLKWEGFPLFYSREHGWTFRVPKEENYTTTRCCLHFSLDEDSALQVGSASGAFKFYKLPHKDGESANVGNPLSKSFVSAAQTGILTSPEKAAMEALDMNAQCSYWISARDRVLNQMVVWNGDSGVNLESPATAHEKRLGLILPQVVTMGTITRRAMEKTWLTASNAKINRVGSELKAMVRAPPGYCFVGADVDSEELWISSVMGDAQFGIHGASAIGWMTLEGTKAAKSDLHSKTAAILGITRDAAKIFNYSRIYGAGMRHAQLLLLQNSPNMQPDMAKKLATELYMATKGKKLNNDAYFGRRFWYGGSESFVFNTLEDIASSSWPKTPALGCGITTALKKQHLPANFGSDYLPSRINWAVQSSGVDYLHLLIVAMEYLIRFYQLRARYLISVHDEIRFMVHEEDKYLVAFALQIANLWTRCQFAFKLGMDDLPQSVAFFSAVDVDHVLRKEPQMPCQTPSHTQKIEPGESLDMASILKRVQLSNPDPPDLPPLPYESPECMGHRCRSLEFLRAQVTDQLNEVKALSKEAKMH
jgi:DNA polymerase gamma 1